MLGVPLLLFGIGRIGFASTTAIAGFLTIATLLPLAGLVLRHRPQEMGLFPDGLPVESSIRTMRVPNWTRGAALRTVALRTVMATFGFGMMVQIGFLTHQVTLLSGSPGTVAVSMTISATAIAAFLGRLALARFSDQVDVRVTASIVLLLAACASGVMALFPSPYILIGASITFGLTVGNVTTLSPIIVRRELGAPSFGAVFGVASCAIQLITGLGPGFYGLLHDAFGDNNHSVQRTTIATSRPGWPDRVFRRYLAGARDCSEGFRQGHMPHRSRWARDQRADQIAEQFYRGIGEHHDKIGPTVKMPAGHGTGREVPAGYGRPAELSGLRGSYMRMPWATPFELPEQQDGCECIGNPDVNSRRLVD